jgi:hypothetical protein
MAMETQDAKDLDPSKESAGFSNTVELPPNWVRISVVMMLAITLLISPLLIVLMLYQSGDLLNIARDHAPAVIGVPWAGGSAFIVVLVLRTSFGAIDFKVLGVEFKGASGPIIMWVFCFLVEVLAIKTLY